MQKTAPQPAEVSSVEMPALADEAAGEVTSDQASATGADGDDVASARESTPGAAAAPPSITNNGHLDPPAAPTPDADTAMGHIKTASSASFLGWIWSEITWLFGVGGTNTPAVVVASAPKQVEPVPRSTFLPMPKQDIERTARATKADGDHIVALQDTWSGFEQDDDVAEERVAREDTAARVEAATREAPHVATREVRKARSGAHISGFWAALEQEDGQIASSLDGTDDLSRFERLTHLQDEQVARASEQMVHDSEMANRRSANALRHSDRSYEARGIHDPWEQLEADDRENEERVHRNPDLQMLQLDHARHQQAQS
jgi:hypothetical protein